MCLVLIHSYFVIHLIKSFDVPYFKKMSTFQTYMTPLIEDEQIRSWTLCDLAL